MTVALMQKCLPARHGYKHEARIGHVLAVFLASIHAVGVGKTAQTKYLLPVDGNRRRGVQIGIDLGYRAMCHPSQCHPDLSRPYQFRPEVPEAGNKSSP